MTAECLKKELSRRLFGAAKPAVLGIGSQLKGDDASGVIAAMRLKEIISQKAIGRRAEVFIGGTAPENITSEIKRFAPSVIIIIDSADMERSPGEISIIDAEDIGGVSLSTHNLPAGMLIDYLTQFLKCDIFIIGIQPRSLTFGSGLSPEVESASKMLAETIADILQ